MFRLPGAGFLCTLGWLPTLCAANPAVINVKTQPSTPLAPGFSGFNVPQPRNGVEYYDPKFLAAVAPLKGGWMRYPGGTSSLAFDWTTGHMNVAWLNALISGNPAAVTGQSASILTLSQQLTQAKGGVQFSDFATFVHTLGAAAILCFNTFTDNNPGSATQMALSAQNDGLNVLEWELGNEAYQYPALYPTAGSYAASANSYYNGIINVSPTATAALFPAGWYAGTSSCAAPPLSPVPCFPNWDNGLQNYTPQYWNAISNHIYPVTTAQTAQATIQELNGILAYGSSDYINSYLIPLAGANTPIFITEFNCCSAYNNKFLSFLYNGIFLAEYIARLSVIPNVKGVGVNSIYTDNSDYHGMIQSVNDYESYLVGQVTANPDYFTNTATDPNTQFQFYTSAPGLALEVANQAINKGSHTLPTIVTGGLTVGIAGFDGNPIPSIYAQTYATTGAAPYILITNKSAQAQAVTIAINGVPVKNTMKLTYVSNSSPLATNTAQAPANVQIQVIMSNNPIQLGPYSVTSVTW